MRAHRSLLRLQLLELVPLLTLPGFRKCGVELCTRRDLCAADAGPHAVADAADASTHAGSNSCAHAADASTHAGSNAAKDVQLRIQVPGRDLRPLDYEQRFRDLPIPPRELEVQLQRLRVLRRPGRGCRHADFVAETFFNGAGAKWRLEGNG